MSLTLQDAAKRLNTPPLQGRGRGWGLSANTIAELRARAAAMRRNPTEPEKRLWRALSSGQLQGYKFRRQSVIGHFIADFLCPSARLIVEVDGDTHDDARDRLRDDLLVMQGYRTVRVTNADVMTNIAGVYEHLLSALTYSSLLFRVGTDGGASPRAPTLAETPHPNPSPEGEGLETVEAQKLLGISLEGSVG